MRQLRKEDLSLHTYIKDTVLRDFIETEEMVDLSLMKDLTCANSYVYQAITDMAPNPTGRGRGWVYFDCPHIDEEGFCAYTTESCIPEFITVSGTDATGASCIGTPEQTNRVEVYGHDLNTISGTNYLVDYVDGRVIFDNDSIIPSYIDYNWNYVSVLDEWPSANAPEPPIVVIDVKETEKGGYQLGAGKKIVRQVDIHIFATSSSERRDLTEVIHDGLYNKSAPIYSFPTGDILDFDGTFYGRKSNNNKLTSLFNRTTLDNLGVTHGQMIFENVISRNVRLPILMTRDANESLLSDLNNYRSRISFELVIYTRR